MKEFVMEESFSSVYLNQFMTFIFIVKVLDIQFLLLRETFKAEVTRSGTWGISHKIFRVGFKCEIADL